MRKSSLVTAIFIVFTVLFSACFSEAIQSNLITETTPATYGVDYEPAIELGEPPMMMPTPPSREPDDESTTEFREPVVISPRPTQGIDNEQTTEYGMPPGLPPIQSRQIATASDKYEEEARLNALFSSLNESIIVERIIIQQIQRGLDGRSVRVGFQSTDDAAIGAWVNVFQAMELSAEQYVPFLGRGFMVFIVTNGQRISLGHIIGPFIHNDMTTMTRIVNFDDLLEDIRHAAALVSPDIII